MLAKVLFVTEVDFWREGTGGRSRSREMLNYLSEKVDLTIISTWRRGLTDDVLIKRLKFKFEFMWLNGDDVNESGRIEILKKIIDGREFDAAIFRSWDNAYLHKAMPDKVSTFIDVDDFRSELYETSLKLNLDERENISLAMECAAYNEFDGIMLIQREHVEKVSAFCDPEKIIFTPHYQPAKNKFVRRDVLNIGLVSSGWAPNLDGLSWFLDHVWPLVNRSNLSLDIYGLICGSITRLTAPNVRLMGYSTNIDAVYQHIDIVINPVRYGSGVKIKTLEALGHGIPVVATNEGARGLHQLSGKALMMSDSPEIFAEYLNNLITNYELRKVMSAQGLEYVRENCNLDFCYSGLVEAIYHNIKCRARQLAINKDNRE